MKVEVVEVGAQRRSAFRAKVNWPVIVETKNGVVEAQTRDISSGGAHIHCDEPIELYEPIKMTINAPERIPLKISARVVWSDQKDNSDRPRIIGVSFTEISEEDQEFIEQQALGEFKNKMMKV
jgi:c-di-GMP-binding flagellar brake protein YcgR